MNYCCACVRLFEDDALSICTTCRGLLCGRNDCPDQCSCVYEASVSKLLKNAAATLPKEVGA